MLRDVRRLPGAMVPVPLRHRIGLPVMLTGLSERAGTGPGRLAVEEVVLSLEQLADPPQAGSTYEDIHDWIVQVLYLLARLPTHLAPPVPSHRYNVLEIPESWNRTACLRQGRDLTTRLRTDLARLKV